MKPRVIVDIVICAAMFALPFVLGIGFEGHRMVILGGIYAGVSILGTLGVLSPSGRDLLDTVAACFILALAWFESFPAWGHSAEIGLYLVFGVLVLKARDLALAVAALLHRVPLTA